MKKHQLSSVKIIFLAMTLFLGNHQVEAQGILDRVINRSKRKIGQKVEDMVVEKASEAIAEKIYKSMSDAFDKMILDAKAQDSSYQANYQDSLSTRYGQLASTWMERMNEAADVPDFFDFNVKISSEISSGRKEKDKSEQIMYFSSGSPIFALQQPDGEEVRIIVIDGEKDLTVLYMVDEDGEKSAQAIPNIMGMAASVSQVQTEPESKDEEQWTVTATGKSKKIAGYLAREYMASSSTYSNLAYVTSELKVKWRDAFGGLMARFSPGTFDQNIELMDGFLMESKTTHADNRSHNSHYVVTRVEDVEFRIDNSEFSFGTMYDK